MTEKPQERPIGKITHYFGKIGVGIIDLTDALKVGDTIHIKGATADFVQPVGSMQVEHEQVQEAKAGQVIGIKVDERAHEGDAVFLVLG
jgi:translation elongation factor EF-1alpha